MSGVLRLDQAAQLWHGGVAIREAWVGGKRVWHADPLAKYYGTGLGQIPLDLRSENAVLDGSGNIVSVTNTGGAGALFDATMGGTPTPPALDAIDIGLSWLRLANPADLNGTRLFVLSRRTSPAQAYFAGAQTGGEVPDTTSIRYVHQGTNETIVAGISSPSPGAIPRGVGVWSLIEVQVLPSDVRLWYNGREVAPGSGRTTPFYVSIIGRHPDTVTTPTWSGQIDALVSLVIDGTGGHDSTIASIRQTLAARRGITLA